MRIVIVLAGALLAASSLVPAAAEESLVDGKPCNAFCRSWMGLPPLPESREVRTQPDRSAEPPARPAARVRIGYPNAPPPRSEPPVEADRGGQAVPDLRAVPPIGGSVTSSTRVARSPASIESEQTVVTDAQDRSTPIVGNPSWKRYADTVFQYRGSLFAADYEKAHRQPPPISASLSVSR